MADCHYYENREQVQWTREQKLTTEVVYIKTANIKYKKPY